MTKPDRRLLATLAAAWDAYGHSIAWDELVDVKSDGAFAALAWSRGEDPGCVNYATLSLVGDRWEMQNDGHEPLSLKDWRRARVARDCDWLEMDGVAI